VPEEGLQPDKSVEFRIPVDTKEIVVGKPDQTFLRFPVLKSGLEFTETDILGVYAVNFLSAEGKNDRSEYFAVNLFDPQESHIKPSPVIHLGLDVFNAAQADRPNRRELWPWLASLALALLLLEWWAYHRRILPGSASKYWQNFIRRSRQV
jgi:hypothetical protein